MNLPSPQDAGALQEELSAYLDGELPADDVRRVEARLATDVGYRTELKRLESTWRMLDRLPQTSVSDDFTRTTIEMVAVAADEEAQAVVGPRFVGRHKLLAAAGLLAALVVGFWIGRQVWPDPNQQLLEDLSVLENFNYYYQADDIDFLRLLERENMFLEGEGDRAD